MKFFLSKPVSALFFILSILPTTISRAVVKVESHPQPFSKGKDFLANIQNAIEQGSLDAFHLRFRLTGDSAQLSLLDAAIRYDAVGSAFLLLSQHSFAALPDSAKQSVVQHIASYYTETDDFTYDVHVSTDPKINRLSDEPALKRLGVQLDHLEPLAWAPLLLSRYVRQWVGRASEHSGPNCWHTSMASIFHGWNKPRYMSAEELMCHQRTYFEEIRKPEKWGDMISFNTRQDIPTHAFTYLGVDRQDPRRVLTFTKNGFAISKYVFMSYEGVRQIYERSTHHVRYYRPQVGVDPLDPAEHPEAPCQQEYQSNSKLTLDDLDPVLTRGISKKPPEWLSPIVVE